MYKSVVYKGEELLGEVEIYPTTEKEKNFNRRILRIGKLTETSERCPPLAVLHTINPNGVCFKMMEELQHQQNNKESQLSLLHSTCLKENKTAVVLIGEEELHLVPMYSRNSERQRPCFWAFNVAPGLYDSCLVMLNLRCLGIVFDLDETLVVANTMRSFEDRIEALQRKISAEVDPQRISGMLAEVKRYQDDKIILKQYVENDQVVENGSAIKVQSEVVPALSDNHQPVVRPIIRLQDKNIILTRINPLIRDTSVLVRLRPAWDDLRNYLTARGRKRFEVYVCTMAERDYALEMWRLLDPESNLINSKELLDRIVCVKSGNRKSLFNVFQDGNCHPKMALVIDDRLKVWDEKDQPRVHVVPAFAPYYAPQAEGNNAIPILCVARNVACNVRGGFFKDFDDGLLQQISEISYEDDIEILPSPPDVSNYLVSEDEASVSYANKDQPFLDGMADIEVERRLKEAVSASSTLPSIIANLDPRLASSLQYAVAASSSSAPISASQGSSMAFPNKQLPQVAPLVKPPTHVGPSEPSLQSSPAREEGEIGESEIDPDTRRRLLILQHGQDMREPPPSEPAFPVGPPVPVPVVPARGSVPTPLARVPVPVPPARVPMPPGRAPVPMPPARAPVPVPVPRSQSHGNWFPLEEEMSQRQQNRPVPKEYPPFFQKTYNRDDRSRSNHPMPGFHPPSSEEASLGQSTSINRNVDFYSERNVPFEENPAEYLQDIAMKCATKVEFRPALVASTELQFSMEVWFAGEKVGDGIGRTRREAQHQAAEGSLMHLAKRYLSTVKDDSSSMHVDGNRFPSTKENGFIGDMNPFGYQTSPMKESMPFSGASEPSGLKDPRLEASKQSGGPISALKELCMMEGLGNVVFQAQPPPSTHSTQKDEVYAQVEIDGQVVGKGIGLTWDDARMQAADKALGYVKSMLGQYNQKRQGSPRSFQGMSSKRLKPEFPRDLQRMPSARYPKNPFVVP